VIADQRVNRLRIEDPGSLNGLGRQGIHQQPAQRPAEPVVSRDVEANLLAVQHRVRQLAPHQLPQDELLLESADLQVLGQGSREIHDARIEERRPHLERMGHAHAVGLVEDVIRQVITLVHPQVPVQHARAFNSQSIHQPAQPVPVGAAADLLPLLVGEGAVPEEVRLVGVQPAPIDPAFQHVLQADLVVRDRQAAPHRAANQPADRRRHHPKRPDQAVGRIRQIPAEQLVGPFPG